MGATRVSALAVQIEAIGTAKVQAALREIGVEGERTSNHLQTHYGRAARNLSIVANQAVRTGELGGTALQKILTVGGDMAGLFGVGGAVVGALAVTGLAIYNYFDRARKQIEETAKAARAELRSLRDASAESAATALNRIAGGDTLADKEIERGSIADLQARRRKLAGTTVDVYTARGTVVSAQSEENLSKIKEIDNELARRNDILKRGLPLLVATAEAEARATIEQGKKGLAAEKESAAAKAEAALTKRIDLLTKGLVFDDLRAKALAGLRQLETTLTAAVNSGTASIEARARAADHLADVQVALARTFAGVSNMATVKPTVSITPNEDTPAARAHAAYGAPMALVNARPDNLIQESKERMEKAAAPLKDILESVAGGVRSDITNTLGDAIYDGFSAAFSGKGLGGVFKAFGKTVLSGMGQMFTQQGMVYLEYAGMMAGFTPHLFNPVTSAWAAAGIGAALVAMGAALGALGSGGGRGGAAHASLPRPAEITNIKLTATSVADQARYDPRSTGNNYYVIGTDDPKAQRELRSMVEKGGRRS